MILILKYIIPLCWREPLARTKISETKVGPQKALAKYAKAFCFLLFLLFTISLIHSYNNHLKYISQ